MVRNKGYGKIWRSSNHNGGGLKKMQSRSHGNLELKKSGSNMFFEFEVRFRSLLNVIFGYAKFRKSIVQHFK